VYYSYIKEKKQEQNMKRVLFFAGLIAMSAAVVLAQTTALPRIGVFEFNTNIDNREIKADAAAVRDTIESELTATGRFRVMTRTEIDKLLENQRFQMSSISSEENINILKMEQISYIVTGNVNIMRGDHVITLNAFNVSVGQISHSANTRIRENEDFYDGVISLVRTFVTGMGTDASGAIVQGPGTTPLVTPTPPATPAPAPTPTLTPTPAPAPTPPATPDLQYLEWLVRRIQEY